MGMHLQGCFSGIILLKRKYLSSFLIYSFKSNKIFIVCPMASIYSKPNSRKKTLFLDHIAETYHLMSSKYKRCLHFILAGDTNELKLDSIINLSPNLKQMVNSPTRGTTILDPIITTLSKFY